MIGRDIDLIYQQTSLVETPEIEEGYESIKDYVDFVFKVVSEVNYDYPESSINLSLDDVLKQYLSQKIQEWKNEKLKYVVVVGIGGSNMGTMAIYRALRGRLDVFLHANDPKIVFIDTVSPPLVAQAINFLENEINSPDDIVVNVISKSGTTTETIANFEVIFGVLKKKFGEEVKNRFVFTTDRGSKLWQAGEEKGIALLEIPLAVGGRYSVLSSVGLFPLGLAGFSVEGFWEGAKNIVARCVEGDVYKNPALLSALITYINHKKGLNIYNNFYFNPELKSLGKWYSQLIAENLGKEYDLENKKVNAGITPMVTIGSTDLHSIGQLCLGGPRDKFTQFVYAPQKENSPEIPKDLFLPGLVPDIAGKGIVDVMNAIYYGVKIAYLKNGLPYSEIVMHEISENSLGQYLQLKMIETIYLAKLMNVNAFNQPKVEDYKRETQEILKKL